MARQLRHVDVALGQGEAEHLDEAFVPTGQMPPQLKQPLAVFAEGIEADAHAPAIGPEHDIAFKVDVVVTAMRDGSRRNKTVKLRNIVDGTSVVDGMVQRGDGPHDRPMVVLEWVFPPNGGRWGDGSTTRPGTTVARRPIEMGLNRSRGRTWDEKPSETSLLHDGPTSRML